jgi:hypothetical protein
MKFKKLIVYAFALFVVSTALIEMSLLLWLRIRLADAKPLNLYPAFIHE